MRRIAPNPLLFLGEALMILPPLVIAVAWMGLVGMGLFGAWDFQMHRPEVERLMTFLLIGALGCFPLGVVILMIAPKGPRPE